MTDINFSFDEEVGINKIRFEKERELSRGPNKGTNIEAWVVSFEFGKPYFDPEAVFLTIADETGEPLYFQHSTAVVEIEKDTYGKYHKKV